MDDLLLSRAFAAVLSSEPYADFGNLITGTTPPGVIASAQDAADLQRPSLALHGSYTSFGPSRRTGDLMLELRSRMGDEGDDQPHAARFAALWTALFGADSADEQTQQDNLASAKAALKSALAALPSGAVTLADYGPAAKAVEQTFDGDDLVTTVTLRVAWGLASL